MGGGKGVAKSSLALEGSVRCEHAPLVGRSLPLACFPMGTEKQLALAAKRLVGMARAPVGTGSAKAALLTADEVAEINVLLRDTRLAETA